MWKEYPPGKEWSVKYRIYLQERLQRFFYIYEKENAVSLFLSLFFFADLKLETNTAANTCLICRFVFFKSFSCVDHLKTETGFNFWKDFGANCGQWKTVRGKRQVCWWPPVGRCGKWSQAWELPFPCHQLPSPPLLHPSTSLQPPFNTCMFS